jgi:ATP synthase I subunit
MASEPMPDNDRSETGPIPKEDQDFLAGAGRRMYRGMWVLGVAGVTVCWLSEGWRWAAGFAIGAALSALNFHWLHTVVASLSELLSAQRGEAPRARRGAPGAAGSALRIVLRYALIAAAGYAIFVSSLVSLEAFFIGLFLFVGAVLVEAAYEIYCGFRSA